MSLRLIVRKNTFMKGGLLATAVAGLMITAVSLAPVSGAYFTDTKSAAINVSTGTLGLAFNGDNANLDFAFDGLVPGRIQSRSFTIKNTGSMNGAVRFVLGGVSNLDGRTLSLAALHYSVSGEGFSTGFDGYGGTVELGTFGPGQQKTFRMDALLDNAAGNEWQGVTASSMATVTLAQL